MNCSIILLFILSYLVCGVFTYVYLFRTLMSSFLKILFGSIVLIIRWPEILFLELINKRKTKRGE